MKTSRDHPRSRGVYTARLLEASWQWGSSPLARGLPISTTENTRTPGIIPARAGFTKTYGSPHKVASDHPRSRGVYPGPG